MREDWTAQGKCVYYAKAFGFIYGMQGLFSLFVNASGLFVNIWSAGWTLDANTMKPQADNTITALDIIGATVFALGFLIEVLSDK